jgi:hypothetical protein
MGVHANRSVGASLALALALCRDAVDSPTVTDSDWCSLTFEAACVEGGADGG